MHNWCSEDGSFWGRMCNRGACCHITKLINFMQTDVEVRNKTFRVKGCRRLVITVLRRALVLFRINF